MKLASKVRMAAASAPDASLEASLPALRRIACLAALVALALLAPSASRGGEPAPREASGHRVVSVSLSEKVSLEMVEATNGFFIGKYEVTQEQWFCLSKVDYRTQYGAKFPIARVSLGHVFDFIESLNSLESVRGSGLRFRLPTEDEWMMCCRAGRPASADGEPAGGAAPLLDDCAWYSANGEETVHDVGTKAPNGWGLYDMLGNVCEYCDACVFGACVIKGGAFCYGAELCTPEYWFPVLPGNFHPDLGFRLAADRVAEGGAR